jgi:hypothetical protein
MNAAIAELLKLRLQGFSYVEKLAGLVRSVSFERAGKTIVLPVGADVQAPLQCGDAEILDLVPDERYGVIVFFEDRGLVPVKSRTRGLSWTSSLRLVCWVNTAKLGGDVNAGDKVMQQFLQAINHGPYNVDPFIGVRHRTTGVAAKGATIFGAYTFPDSSRQYLLYPFDAFALEIATEFRVKAGCEPEVSGTDVACWTPPATMRRRHPRDFSCEELTDPTNGLTAEQLDDCLNCSGGPADPCPLEVRVNGETITTIADPCDAPTMALTVEDEEGAPVTVTLSGNTIIVPAMPQAILPFDTRADAIAETSAVPTKAQLVHVVESGRFYPGNGTDHVSALVAAERFLLPVREEGQALITTVDGTEVKLQINT